MSLASQIGRIDQQIVVERDAGWSMAAVNAYAGIDFGNQ
jgi:hypothetical protein